MIQKIQKSRIFAGALIGATLTILASCNTSVLPTPPLAEVGDTFISVSVKAEGRQLLPRGSRVVVVLADITNKSKAPVALGGDSIPMSQADSAIRIAFPADLKTMRKCKRRGVCGVLVQVVKRNSVVLSNRTPVPFKLGQKNIVVRVEG